MYRIRLLARLLFAISVLLAAGCTLIVTPETAAPATPTVVPSAGHTPVRDVALLGVITIPNNTVAFAAPVGGLSAIAYAAERDTFYFLSDDRAAFGPTRIYAATVDVSDGTFEVRDLTWTGMISLLDASGEPFARGALDPEGLAYHDGSFYVSTEGEAAARPMIDPAILHFALDGSLLAALPLPNHLMPVTDGSRGVRNNKGLESLTLTPGGGALFTGVENALAQDGPLATRQDASPARLLRIDLADQQVTREVLYWVDAIPAAPQPATGDADNGLADLAALDDQGMLLALERSYVQGVGNTVRLYQVDTRAATDVRGIDALAAAAADAPASKTLVVDFGVLGSEVGVAPDNLEGMALGPRLADGRVLLLVVSDNNFNPSQTTQVWALALTIDQADRGAP